MMEKRKAAGMSNIEVLVATMDKDPHELAKRMNIVGNAVICNQCNHDAVEHVSSGGYTICVVHSSHRGVGKNRNEGIIRASGDYLLFADDDVCYHQDYSELVFSAFQRQQDADIIVFNLKGTNANRAERNVDRTVRLHWFNSMHYGTYKICIKRNSLLKANVWFSLLFGGGAKFGSGEDTLFLQSCLRKGLRAYAVNVEIGVVNHQESTWFKGYTDKYFIDKGALFACLGKWFFYIMSLNLLIRHRKEYTGRSIREVFRLFLKGRHDFKNLTQ